jgi:hypothetical protein
MMNSVVSKAKNLNKAIAIGLELLEATSQEVDIEILEPGSKGFLRFILSKPAIVKLTKKQEAAAQQSEVNPRLEPTADLEQVVAKILDAEQQSGILQRNVDHDLPVSQTNVASKVAKKNINMGSVWIRDGQIFCKESLTHYPTISIAKEVKCYKNGELVKGTIVVTEKDTLRVDLETEIQYTSWSIDMDSTKMKVTLTVTPGYTKKLELMDEAPDHHLRLQVKEDVRISNSLSPREVLEQLQAMRIGKGIDNIELLKATETLEPAMFDVATGIEPQPGKNGWLELVVNTQLKEDGPKQREDGSVDYREIKTIPTVDKGQLIAFVHLPEPGKPGLTVTGETVLPPPSEPLIVQTKRGVILIDNGTKIVAIESGRPQINQRGMSVSVSIMPRLFLEKDVDLSSGNIYFLGDVEVAGSVQESMSVEADGDVFVHGMANKANIVAGNRIVVRKNVINSELTAGKSNLLVSELGQLIGEIAKQIKGLEAAIEQIAISPAFKTSDLGRAGLTPLLKILMEKKFKSLSLLIKQVADKIQDKRKMFDNEWLDLTEQLVEGLLRNRVNELRELQDLRNLAQRSQALYELNVTPPEPNSSIVVPFVWNSRIYCSGDITITEKGAINSKIHCGGRLHIEGMVRGGELYAELGVEIVDAGSEGGVRTTIRVPDGQTIRIEKVMDGNVIQIGNKKHHFLQDTQNVFARVDREGGLLLY